MQKKQKINATEPDAQKIVSSITVLLVNDAKATGNPVKLQKFLKKSHALSMTLEKSTCDSLDSCLAEIQTAKETELKQTTAQLATQLKTEYQKQVDELKAIERARQRAIKRSEVNRYISPGFLVKSDPKLLITKALRNRYETQVRITHEQPSNEAKVAQEKPVTLSTVVEQNSTK